jgi:beta-glucosidase
MHHILKAHGAAIEVMRGLGMSNLGAVVNCEYAYAADDTAESAAAATRYDEVYNHFFLSGLFKGTYPPDIVNALAEHMPKSWEDDFALIGQPLDWCGINYYTCKGITHQDGPWPNWKEVIGRRPKTQMGWEIYPEGLTHFLKMVHAEYTQDLPLFVTENGMANADTPGKSDTARMDYLDAHLNAALDAMRSGVPLQGYTFWSLLDNFEWSLGYEKRFGLIHVDFETYKRTPKASFHRIKSALAR